MANYTKKTWWVEHTNFVALKRTIGRCAHYTDENYHNTALVSMIKFFRKMEEVKENQETLDGFLSVMENIKKQHKKLGHMSYELIVLRNVVRTRFHDYLQENFEKNIIDMVLSAF